VLAIEQYRLGHDRGIRGLIADLSQALAS